MNASTHDLTFAALDMSLVEGSRYLGGTRGRAVETLSQAIRDQEILVLLTGAAGVGKTVVLNATLAILAVAEIRAIRLSNPDQRAWSQHDLARQILGGPVKDPASPEADAAANHPADAASNHPADAASNHPADAAANHPAHRDLAATIAELTAATAGEARVVIAVDDAQTLTDEAMELLLLLASPARGSRRPPQLILSGRGEFWERERQSELQLIARLAERVTLKALAGPDAADYIAFRLKQAAGSNQVISSEALTAILQYSGGLPARIDRVLGPANSIRVCRDSRVLTGDMVEAAIATLASAPAAPFSDPVPGAPFSDPVPGAPFSDSAPGAPFSGSAPIMTRMVPTPSADWVPPPRPIYFASSSPDPVSPAEAIDGSAPVLASRPPALDRSPPLPGRGPPVLDPNPPVLDPNPPVLVAPVFRSPSSRLPPASGGVLVPFQVETPGSATTTLMVQDIAPERRRVGRKATAVAPFVLILGSLACVLAVPGVRLANAIIWPWSSGLTATSGVHPDRPLTPMAPSGVQPTAKGAAVQEFTAIALPAGVRSEKPDGASIQPRPTSRTEPLAMPAVTGAPAAAVTEAVSPAVSNGAARRQLLNAGSSNAGSSSAGSSSAGSSSAAVAEAEPASRAPVAVGGGLPSREREAPPLTREREAPPLTSPESSVAASAAALAPGGLSGAQTAEARPIHTSQHIANSPPVAAALSPEMVAFLLRRGDTMLQQGDVRSARLYFEQAAEAGSGQGAIAAAKTYDPVFLATIDAPGLQSDVARAIKWYRVASAASGDQYAAERLKALAAQTDR